MMKLNSLQAIKRISASRIARNFCTSDSRYKKITPPFNWGIQIVPERTAFVIERFGLYHKTLYSGIHFVPPFINKIAFVHPLKAVVVKVEAQKVVTKGGTTINLDSVIYLQIIDPVKASYAAPMNPFDASVDRARYVIAITFGRVELEAAFKKGNENLSVEIMGKISEEVHGYGVKCSRFLIRNLYMAHATAETLKLFGVEPKWLSAAEGVEPVAEQILHTKEAKQCTAFLRSKGSVIVHSTQYSLSNFVAVGWIKYEAKHEFPYRLSKMYQLEDYESLVVDLANAIIHARLTPKNQMTEDELHQQTIDSKHLLMEDLQQCLDLIGMRLVDFSVGWEESNRVNVSFQLDDTAAIDALVKKVKPLIEAARPYTLQDFSRWKPSIQYIISKLPIDHEVSSVLNKILDLAASNSSRAMEVDEIEIEPTKIYVVMTMARVTRGAATAALKSNKGDMLMAIQELTHCS